MSQRLRAGQSDERAALPSGGRKKRVYKSIPVACNGCRRRKTACDGLKPACTRCRTHDRACIYEFDVQSDETRQAAQSRAREDANQQLMDIAQTLRTLTSVTDAELLRLTKHVLTSSEPLDALARLHQRPLAGVPLVYASRFDTPRASLDREYELARLHPAAYPCALSMLQSIFCNGFPMLTDSLVSSHLGQTAMEPDYNGGSLDDHMAALGTRLRGLRIGVWTHVQIPDALAIEMIVEFLATEHLVLIMFETELFIEDLLSGRTRFCSELLVTTILFTTCQSRAGSSARFRLLRAEFLADARRLWARDQPIDGAITLAASQLLAYSCMVGGVDDLMDNVDALSQFMWDRLNDLAEHPDQLELYRPPLTSDDLKGMAHVGWATFNWKMLFYRYYGDETARSTDAFEELTQLRTIEHEIRRTFEGYRAAGQAISDFVPLQFVSRKYVELLAWVDDLDEAHQKRERAPYHILVLHMWYHIVLMDLFRPFVNRRSPDDLIAPASRNAEYLFIASLDQLKALVIRLRFSQPFPRNAVLWHTALVNIVNCVLRAAYTATDRLFYFRLCVDSYFDVLSAFPLAFEHIKVIICLALHEKIVDRAEANNIWKRLQTHDRLRIDTTRAAHLVDLNLGLSSGSTTLAEMASGTFDEMFVRERS
ncbi:hypothetical protein AMS68_003308 [Peltaster fructicola]|uniref:Zn(2)-C6 fungal-type domain-containing protein n=1 Tax=Peltaster fructicola TaxID=286661 RepID=A0A6H0XSZ9_9PEZI|nr:hypothetical protein AMS68_003308 [Peltaster fructicola]